MNKDNYEERVSSQVMELKELISGPLLATIDADSIAAQRYLDYLFKISFETYDSSTGNVGPLRMLTFTYLVNDLSGSRNQTISIPLLTLIPLPLLQVQEADFDFDIQVLDAFSQKRQSSFSFNEGEVINEADNKEGDDTRLRVALVAARGGVDNNSESRAKSLSANMKVHVKMRQANMPGGLSVLLSKAVNNMVSDTTFSEVQ